MGVNLAGIIVALVALAAGGGAMVAAPSIGISESSALPFGLLVAGIVACLVSWHQSVSGNPNSIILPIWMYGTASAIFGLFGLIGLIGLTGPAPITKEEERRLEEIRGELRKSAVSGSNQKARDAATRYHGTVSANAKKLGGGEKASVYVDVAGEGDRVRSVAMYVRLDGAGRMKEDDLKTLLSICIKLLQTDFPHAACGAAVCGPEGWAAHSQAKGPNMPAVHVIRPELPRF